MNKAKEIYDNFTWLLSEQLITEKRLKSYYRTLITRLIAQGIDVCEKSELEIIELSIKHPFKPF